MIRGRFTRFALVVLALAVYALVIVGLASDSSIAADSASVDIMGFAFSPATIAVPVGTTVTWTNQDSVPHTVTSDSGAWDSGTRDTSQSFSFTFTSPGSFAYHCAFHSSMRGTVTVTQANTSTPIPSAASSPPSLDGPAAGATLASFGPMLTWSNPPGTTQSHLQVIPANNDGPGVDLHVGSPDTAFQIPPPPQWYGLLPDMGYTWRVRVSNAGAFVDLNDPSWSSWVERTFRTPAVSSATISAVSPSNNSSASTLTPTLQWTNSRTDVFYYEVQLSKDRNFNTDPSTATAMVYGELRHGGATSPPNSYTVPASFPLENNVTYFWRIRPRVQGDGTPLPWSAVWVFTTAQPTQTTCIDYSDGTYEGTSANEQGQALAVLFTLPSPGRWQVTHLRYHISRKPVPFDAAVFSLQQAELARQRVEPTDAGLVEVDISARNVVVDGDFYGALVYLQGSAGNTATFGPFIGRDSSMPDGRSWVTKPGGIWKTWRQEDIDQSFGLGDGDFAIIACVRGPA